MKIVHLTRTPMAGSPHTFVNLINKYTEHDAYLFIEKPIFCGFSFELYKKENLIDFFKKDFATSILNDADILHIHGNVILDSCKIFGINIRDFIKKKTIVLHYHGMPQIGNSKTYFRNVPLLVCIPDMLLDYPNALFFPNLIDEQEDIYKKKNIWNNKVKFAQIFTLHAKIKQQDIFLQMKGKYPDNDFDIIPQMNNKDSLDARLQYDVIFDHLRGHYGIVSLECLAQGIPVINYLNSTSHKGLVEFFGELPPFLNVKPYNFEKCISNIISNKIDLRNISKKSIEFVEKKWNHENIKRLIKYYELL